jgi:hypothetical protein
VRLDWLYPELKRIDPKDRIRALQKAKEVPFDAIELIGIGIALVLVVGVTRYSVAEMGLIARVGAALANFIVAIPLLMIFAGPFYVRRVRRGLREFIQTNLPSKAD